MEVKDLVLLIAIPLLLGSILFYADSITGAAVAGEKSSKTGEYSVLPSFKVKTGYSLDEYKNLKIQLKNIIDACKDDNIEKCIGSEAARLKWKCDEKEKEILYRLADSLNDCAKIEGKAACAFSFQEIDGINKISGTRDFEIKIVNSNGKIKFELRENGKLIAEESLRLKDILYTDFNGRDSSGNIANSIILKIRYEDRKPSIIKFAALNSGKETRLSSELAYKSGDVKFIDDIYSDSFKGSKPAIKSIKVPFTRGMKFCVPGKKEVFVYENEKLEKKNITYRFSVTFPKPVPEPVDEFEALDAVKAEKGAVLVWKENKAISNYNVYYSLKNFIGMPVKNMKNYK